MATLKPKAKSKKPGKSSRPDSRNLDLSVLRKPISISVSSLKETAKLLESGTPEIKDLLTYEVNLLYECRICRSIFRSIVNLLSHKRVFCRERVNVTTENKSRDDNEKFSSAVSTDPQSLDLDQIALDHLMNPSTNDRILRSQAPGKANKKDLTSVLDMLQKKQVENLGELAKENENFAEEVDCPQVVLQVLDSKRAAFQTLIEPNLRQDDLMENQVIELENMLNQDTVMLGPDGLIEKSDSPVDFYSNEETNKLVCDMCSKAFSTQKTLNSHIKIKHAEVRECYLCPCNSCPVSFTSYASVKRHLTNVHRKIGPELRNLSHHIQKRTLRTKAISVTINKKPKKPEVTNNSLDESQVKLQEWIEQLDPQEEVHECISCEERFEEKSELVNHSTKCLAQNHVRVLEEIADLKESLLENDIVCEDSPDLGENMVERTTPETLEIVSSNVSDDNRETSPTRVTSTVSFGKEMTNNMSIRVQGISSLTEEDWKKLPEWSSENEENTSTVKQTQVDASRDEVLSIKRPSKTLVTESKVLDSPEIIYTSVDISKKRKFSSLREINDSLVQGEKFKKKSLERTKNEKMEAMRPTTELFSERIASIADHRKLECIACRRIFANITSFDRHMVNHIRVNRYRCNKCDFKSVSRNDCVGHCNKMHNAMNNRQVLNEMISQITPDQLTCQEMITVDASNLSLREMRRTFSDYRSENINPITNVFQKHLRRQSILNSDSVNPSDTDTETEDRETIYRKIDSNPNLKEMITEVVIGTNTNILPFPSNSNLNGVNQLLLQNNNLEKKKEQSIENCNPTQRKIDGCNLTSKKYDCLNCLDEEDDITYELCPKNKHSEPSSRGNLGAENRSPSRESRRSISQNIKRSESRMSAESFSRLERKLNSDDEDEITRELYTSEERRSSLGQESSSQLSKLSDSKMEIRTEPKIRTRSRSQLENKSDCHLEEEENNEDYCCNRILNNEGKTPRSKSQMEKEISGRSASRQGRGKSRGKRLTPAKVNSSVSPRREERSESFSSENSQTQRPVRNRVKHIEKDFIYDMEDVNFHKGLPYSSVNSPSNSPDSSEKKSIHNRFDDEIDDINFIEERLRTCSGSDVENSELFFRGFPRQPEIVNVE